MKTLLIVALAASVTSLYGAYSYDYTRNTVRADSTEWVTNGSPSYGSQGVTFTATSGGSLISQVPITSGNDYEVKTTLTVTADKGTFIQFLRASSNAMPGSVTCSGPYVSVELVIPKPFDTLGTWATLNINQCSSGGTVSNIGHATVTAATGMEIRSVVFGGTLWVFIGGLQVFTGSVTISSGSPGIGGYNMGANSGIQSVALGHHDTIAPNAITTDTVATSIFPTSLSLKWNGVPDDPNGIGVWGYSIQKSVAGGQAMNVAFTQAAEFADTVNPGVQYTYTISAFDYHGNTGTAANISVTAPPEGAIDPRRTGLLSTGSYWGGAGEQIDSLSGNVHFAVPLLTAQGRTGSTIPVSLVYDSQNWRQDGTGTGSPVNWQLGSDVGYGFGWKLLIGSVAPYYPYLTAAAQYYLYTDSSGAQYRLDTNPSNLGVWTSSTQSVYVWLDTTVYPNRLHFRDGSVWVMGGTSGGAEKDAGTMYPTIIEDTFGNQTIITYDVGQNMPVGQEENTSSRIVAITDVRAVPCTGCGVGVTSATYSLVYDQSPTIGSPPQQNPRYLHMTSFQNYIGTSEYSGTFGYTTVAQNPPFGMTDSTYGNNVETLTSLPIGPLEGYQFSYDTSATVGAGELVSATFPYGGKITWGYTGFEYNGNRTLREVNARSVMQMPNSTTPTWTYGILRSDPQNQVTVHSAMTLTDASGIGAKTWTFNTSGSPWQLGLVSDFQQLSAVGGNILHDDQYAWSQDPAGRPYISAKTSISDEGQSYQQSAYSTQMLDRYGNVTTSAVYPYNNQTTPLHTYVNTFITNSNYTSSYIYNLLSTSVMDTTTTLVSNYYDTSTCQNGPFGGSACGGEGMGTAPTTLFDSKAPTQYPGALTTSVTLTKAIGTTYYVYGGVSSVSATDGTNVTASADASTNYAAPLTITAQNYSQAISYNAFLGITSQTGANGEELWMTYDSYGRPTTGTSPYGAVTTYTYNRSAPFTQTASGPSGVTITTLDGFGRPTLVQRGDSGTPDSTTSYTSTVYAACACSPLGKQSQVSQPYPSGSPTNWTTWTYDGLGRPVSVQGPDGASKTTYSYAGNVTTVADPAGNSKTFTKDVLGNLTTVVEPDPCVTSNSLTTSYAYNWMNQLTQVSMQRPAVSYSGTACSEGESTTGSGTSGSTSMTVGSGSGIATGQLVTGTGIAPGTSVTAVSGTTVTLSQALTATISQSTEVFTTWNAQTRTFVYDSGGRLTSATNPENGTVTYTYNVTNTLKDKHDAKGQDTVYTYDSSNRVTEIQRYPSGVGNAEDVCARVTYTYDTNPIHSGFSQNSYGRLTTTQYYVENASTNGFGCGEYGLYDTYTEMYSYQAAGAVTAKNLGLARIVGYGGGGAETANASLEVDYTQDTVGRTSTVTYPMSFTNSLHTQPVLTMAYDAMGRPSSLTDAGGDVTPAPTNWVSGAEYDFAGRLASLNYLTGPPSGPASMTETRTYNSATGQLQSINWPTAYGLDGVQYQYSTTHNNGQITQQVDDFFIGPQDTIAYTYDALKRLTSAVSTNTSGNYGTAYTETFQYDGFSNLTAKVLNNGTPQPLAVNPATNWLNDGQSYDANGNMTSGAGGNFTYDEANRVNTVAGFNGGDEQFYGYDASNKRIYVRDYTTGTEMVTFYGAQGEKLGVYSITSCGGLCVSLLPITTSVWFAGRLVMDSGTAVYQDRLGTNRAYGQFYPFGEGITATTGTNTVMFAGYLRDSYTGVDYANQRFYASSYGRFNTPDPYVAGGAAKGSVSNPKDPGSWNRYGYVEGDPINNVDPTGQWAQNPCAIWGSLSWSCDPFGGLWGDPPNSFYPLSCTLNPSGCVEQLGVELGGAGGSVSPTQAEWNALNPTCQQALETAVPNTPVAGMLAAFNNAAAAESTLVSAVAGTSISWTMLTAIGIRETGFNSGPQVCPPGVTWGASNCNGYGVFQITISAATGVTTAQAGNLTFAAGWAAQLLNSNMAYLASMYSGSALIQATAASFNMNPYKPGNFTGNPGTIDVGTTGGNYGSNIAGLMTCFQ